MVRSLKKLPLLVGVAASVGLAQAKLSVVATTPDFGAIASAVGRAESRRGVGISWRIARGRPACPT